MTTKKLRELLDEAKLGKLEYFSEFPPPTICVFESREGDKGYPGTDNIVAHVVPKYTYKAANLIAAAVNALPELLDELDKLHEAQAAHANYIAVRWGTEEGQLAHLHSAGDRLNRAMRAIGLRSDD